MRHAILASSGTAGDVRDEAFELPIDPSFRIPHRGRQLRKSLCEFRLALHDENAVRNKPEVLLHGLKLFFQFGRVLRWERPYPRRRFRVSIHQVLHVNLSSMYS